MDGAKLSEAVWISPGFNTAVTLETDLDNEKKVRAYIPTRAACEVLLDLEKQLHPMVEGPRSRVITGTYGTGKSHLSLMLARLYRDGAEDADLGPMLDKMDGKWPGQAKKLRAGRSKKSGYFLVLLEGDEGHFEDALLSRLTRALRKANLSDLIPETAFTAAVARVEDLRLNYADAYSDMVKRAPEFGVASLAALVKQLENSEKAAYEKFRDLYREVLSGAEFTATFGMKPRDVYSAVASRLVNDHGYSGIAVIWDEFGRYMERVVDDPRGLEGDAIQKFAEGCNHGKGQLHLYLICHRSLQEYASLGTIARAMGTSKKDEDDWRKIVGRFHEFRMQSTDHEVFDLIDQVVVQMEDSPVYQNMVSDCAQALNDCTSEAMDAKLFPEFGREDVHSVVTLGAFPLHPMAAFLLPRVSQEVAQNERTLFTFLSHSGAGTLGPFLSSTPAVPDQGRPPFFTADLLWDYFVNDVAAHPVHRRLMPRFERADTLVPVDDALAKRILKSVALLSVVALDRTPATAELIRMTLGLPASQMEHLQGQLDSLSSAQGDHELVLVRNVADQAYRFATVGASGGLDDSAISAVVTERLAKVTPAAHLRSIVGELQMGSEQIPLRRIPSTLYNDDYGTVDRGLTVEFMDETEVGQPGRWTSNLGSGDFVDGYALIALCEDRQALDAVEVAAVSSLAHEQLLIGIPTEPTQLGALLRRHEAIRHLAAEQPYLYGEGAPLREEWEQRDRDFADAITRMVESLLDPDNAHLTWFTNGVQKDNVATVGRLRSLASDMMRLVFRDTPRIAHDRLTSDEGSDSQSSVRKEIIGELMSADGPSRLAAQSQQKLKRAIDAVLRRTGILRQQASGWIVAEPDAADQPEMQAAWSAVEACIQESMDHSIPLKKVVDCLKSPPFGMRARSIPIVVASVFRKYLDFGNLSIVGTSGKALERADSRALDEALLWPGNLTLVYREIGAKQMAVRDGIGAAFDIFAAEGEDGDSCIQRIRQAVAYWWRGLPRFAVVTESVSEGTATVRRYVFMPLADDSADASTIILEDLADRFSPGSDVDAISSAAVQEMVALAREELDGALQSILVPRLRTEVAKVFGDDGSAPEQAIAEWFEGLPEAARQTRVAGDPMDLANFAERTAKQESDVGVSVLDLAQQILGSEPSSWVDETVTRVCARLEGARRTAEIAGSSPRVTGTGSGTGVAGGLIEVTVPPGQVRLSILGAGDPVVVNFVPVEELSATGVNLSSVVRSTVIAMKSLPAGECETILVRLLSDVFK